MEGILNKKEVKLIFLIHFEMAADIEENFDWMEKFIMKISEKPLFLFLLLL